MCSARWAEGRATMTTDASSTIISWATAITARAQYRRGLGALVWSSAGGVITSIATDASLCRTAARGHGPRPALGGPWPWGRELAIVGTEVPVMTGTIRNDRSGCQAGRTSVRTRVGNEHGQTSMDKRAWTNEHGQGDRWMKAVWW